MDFDRQSISSTGSRAFERPGSDIKKTGYLKKMKTMKKKFFVLRSTSSSGPARLEYYDSEKKFKSGNLPKRAIHLHTCFNINKKSDSRQGRYGIALYAANEECFTVLAESEKDQEAWLSVILEFQNEYLPDGDMHKEHYDYVWQVTLQARGLGHGKGGKGHYRLCLNSTTISLIKINSSAPQFTIQLVTIRSVAHHENSFRLEVGNYAPTGAGEFWFTVEDAAVAKDMHETLLQYMNSTAADQTVHRDPQTVQLRSKRDSHAQSMPCYPPGTLDAHSPGSPNYPIDYSGGMLRLRSDSRTSRTSKASFHDDLSPGFMTSYNGSHDVIMREHFNVVPADMSPPPSPGCLDEEINEYLAMDMEKSKQRSSLTSVTSSSSHSSSYLPMTADSHRALHKDEMSGSYTDAPSAGYIPMAVHHAPATSHPIPIHAHSFSEPLHSTHLPTVREGGSNEGYLPMDVTSSPGSSSDVPRPEPAMCLLSDDTTGLPPRTYSLGSKPAKKFSSYIEMGAKKGAGNDISRATSAPHILKGRKEREHRTESPTPSASSLSMSLKSDDSDSFMDYIPMRPRTASDSFNYRNRTSSFGKSQQNCRPRSSSHGQGTRPVINFSKNNTEKSRTLQEPVQRTSQESSLQGSFDSLRISSESLRRMSQEMRQTSGSNASDYAEMRSTPSPQIKNTKSDADGYMSMLVGPGGRSSPHRTRTDSSGSGRYPDLKTNSSDHLHQHPHLQQANDYQEMAPLNTNASHFGDSYISMDYNMKRSFNSDSKSLPSVSLAHPPHHEDPRYFNMNLDDRSKKSDGSRSLSMENVDSYIVFEPQSGSKPRTGSLGSKDRTVSRPASTRKSSSASVSSASSPSSSGIIHPSNQPSVSLSTRTGGSSDSIKKTSRQISYEKYGVTGKDFRKKSGSTGSRPSTDKNSKSSGKDHHKFGPSILPGKKLSTSQLPQDDVLAGEYIEVSLTATKENNHNRRSQPTFHQSALSHSNVPLSNLGWTSPLASGGGFSSAHSNTTPSPAADEAYTLFSPAAATSTKTVHFSQQEQHSHHLSAHIKPGTSPSSSSIHAKQIAKTDAQEYVGFEPRNVSSSSQSFGNVKQVEAKETPQYVGFEPRVKPLTPSSLSKTVSPNVQEDYIGFQPGTSIQKSQMSFAPLSAVSYIQSGEDALNRQRQQGNIQLHMPVGGSSSSSNNNNNNNNPKLLNHETRNSHLPKGGSHGCDHHGQSGTSSTSSQIPSVPTLSVSKSSSQQNQQAPKHVVENASEYITFSPGDYTDSKSPQVSIKKTQDKAEKKLANTKLPSQDKAEKKPANTKPPLTQLFIDVGEQPGAPSGITENSSREQNKQKLQPQQNFYRQLSAPASQFSPVSQPTFVESQRQAPSPQLMSPNTHNTSKQKHLSGSSVLDSPSPTGSGTRHKHCSGSSNSSQKSRKSSSDSERAFRKGNKSDAAIGSVSGKNKCRMPSGDKSPEDCFEENSQLQKYGESTYTSSLEAKIIPAEAKIRYSLGDVASVVGKVNRVSTDHHGLIRPDSTPCIQNLASCVDQGSRSVGDTPNTTPRSGSIQFSVGARSRHSLSDLGAYQQMNFAPSPVSLSSESSNSPGNRSVDPHSGEQASKPLNYVKLDLSCSEAQGDADGKSCRGKNRNSSDGDDKQPPLSYAEIDFVKSQNWNKTIPMGITGENVSSKSEFVRQA